MSITKPLDGWDENAGRLLRRRLFEGSPDSTVDYAPDFRNGQPGPLTIQINRILREHAGLWAQRMRESTPATQESGRASWLLEMREADAAIKRHAASAKLTTGAAA
jgi:hypothetical protein